MVIGQLFFFGGFVAAVIGLIISYCIKNKTLKLIANFVGIIGFIAFVLSILAIALPLKTEIQYSHYFNIYAIEDTARIKGSRFYIEEQDRYYYLADYRDGQKQFWVSTNISYIKEDDSISPRIEVYKYVTVSKFWRWIKGDYYDTLEYKIIVPTETLTTNFNIDLKK